MKNILIVLALVSWIVCIESQEKRALIPKGNVQDEEAGLVNSHNVIISRAFLPRINSQEVELAARSIANEMKWLEDFYNASLVNPMIVKTRAEEIAHKKQAIQAILDHINQSIREQNGKKWGQRSVNCINPCSIDDKDTLANKCKGCVLVWGSILGFSGWLTLLLTSYPWKAEGCMLLNMSDFMDNCVGNSILHDSPFNATQMAQEYGDNYQQQALYPACYNLAHQECKRLADEYNHHEYPKLELKAWMPTVIGLPVLITVCTACQLVSCKYRRWKNSSDRLRADASRLNNTIDKKVTQMTHALNSYEAQKTLATVD
jgi:hypothetical protein